MIRLPLRRLRLPGVLGAIGVAAVLAGCGPGIATEASHQNDIIGTAEVDQTLCANANVAAANGDTPATLYCDSALMFTTLPTQYLLAYLVRSDVTAPSTIDSTNDVLSPNTNVSQLPEGTPTTPDQTITYQSSPTYTAELQRLYPAPSGQQWVGYLSNPVVGPELSNPGATDTPGLPTQHLAPDQWDVAPQFALNQPADGPFTGPFTYRTLVGMRWVDPTGGEVSFPFPIAATPDDPVVCVDVTTTATVRSALSEQPADGLTGPQAVTRALDTVRQARGGTPTFTGNAVCDGSDDSPEPVTTTTAQGRAAVPAADPTANPNTQDTRDLWIGGSAGPSITQGQSGQVAFTLKFAGAQSPGANFALTATDGNLPGGTLVAQPPTYNPAADSTQTVPVTIAVPDNAPVGPHTVELTASLPNGQHRSAIATYTVAAKPVTVVAPSRSAGRVWISHRFLVRITRSRGERVRLVCPASAPKGCSGSLVLTSRFGRSNALRFRIAAGKSRTYVLKPSGSLLRYLRHHRRGKWVTVTAIATNRAPGTIAATSRRVLHIAPIRPARHPFGVHHHRR